MDEELLTVTQVAEILKIDRHKVYSMINEGILPAMKLGCLKIRSSKVKKFMEDYEGMDLTDYDHITKYRS